MTSPSTPDRSRPIRLGGHTLDLRLRPGALCDLPDVLATHGITRTVLVIDYALRNGLGRPPDALLDGWDTTVVEVKARAADKTLERVAWLADQTGHVDGVVAVGGGTIGNLAGSLAHLPCFGRPLVHVPTTLVAAVDASISARHGLNTVRDKHLVGIHHAPVAVLTDPTLLDSLPAHAWREGAIEAVKAAIISGGPAAEHLAGTLAALAAPDTDMGQLVDRIDTAITLKARLLADDPHETGPALALHYGHTFASALETRSGYAIRHGPAVATGMLLAARLAQTLGLLTAEERALHDTLTMAACPPAPVPYGTGVDALVHLMGVHPKQGRACGDTVPMVLPHGIGAVHYPPGVPIPVTPIDRRHVAEALSALADRVARALTPSTSDRSARRARHRDQRPEPPRP